MIYDVLDVARYIVNYGSSHHYNISNLKLQKILYFVQAQFLVNKGEACFDENLEAWDFGPVVPEVYHEFKKYGSSEIPYVNEYVDLSNGIWGATTRSFDENVISSRDKQLINDMVDECAKYSASQLVDITHKQSPWLNCYIQGFNNIIPQKAIRDYFIKS